MLVQMVPEQVSFHWPMIKRAVNASLPPIAGESPEKLNNILMNILLNRMQCWAEVVKKDDDFKLRGIVLTEVTLDEATGTRNFLIYCGASFERLGYEDWIGGLKTLKKYALSKECGKILLYTKVKGIVQLFKRLNAEVYSFISLDIGD